MANDNTANDLQRIPDLMKEIGFAMLVDENPGPPEDDAGDNVNWRFETIP